MPSAILVSRNSNKMVLVLLVATFAFLNLYPNFDLRKSLLPSETQKTIFVRVDQDDRSSDLRKSLLPSETQKPIFVPVDQDDRSSDADQRKQLRAGGTSVDCRMKWDLKKNTHLINQWLEMELPILVTAIRHDRGKKTQNHEDSKYYQNTKNDIVYAILTEEPQRQSNKVMEFQSIPWMCLYEKNGPEEQMDGSDEDGKNRGQGVQELAALAPRTRKSDHVIVMCNSTSDDNTMVLKGIFPTTIPFRLHEDSKSANATKNNSNDDDTQIIKDITGNFDTRKNSASNFFYDLQEPLECDRLEEQEMSKVHEKKKIGACLRFKGEFDRSLVPQWIEYHRLIGVEHFWIYINEAWNLSGLFNRSYISYVPFDLNWAENNHSSHFPHHYSLYSLPGLSQEPAQWSCVYNARKYNYNWVITTDVDEYIHVPKPPNETTDVVSSPLQSHLERFDPSTNGCLVMNQIPFGRNIWLKQPDFPQDHFLLDYVWRRNLSLSEYPIERFKQIYNPQNVWSIGVHYCHVSDGRQNVPLNVDDGLFFQHYKLADKGVFKKLAKHMVKSEDDLLRDTRLRDMYRTDLADAMEKLKAESISVQ